MRSLPAYHGNIIEARSVKKDEPFDAVPMRDAHIYFLYLNEKKVNYENNFTIKWNSISQFERPSWASFLQSIVMTGKISHS